MGKVSCLQGDKEGQMVKHPQTVCVTLDSVSQMLLLRQKGRIRNILFGFYNAIKPSKRVSTQRKEKKYYTTEYQQDLWGR